MKLPTEPKTSLIAIGIFAMFMRLWFGYLNTSSAAACDGHEYLLCAESIKQFQNSFWETILEALSGRLDSEPQNFLHFREQVKALTLSGPAYPLFIALTSSLSQKIVGLPMTSAVVMWQCVLSSATCILTGFLALKVGGKTCALSACLIAALYPGFIINAGRLYPETFCTFLLTLLSFLVLKAINSHGSRSLSFSIGVILALIPLCRPALILIGPITFFFIGGATSKTWRRESLLILMAGFVTTLFPWIMLQETFALSPKPFVDRMMVYNLTVGSDFKNEGWLPVPYPILYDGIIDTLKWITKELLSEPWHLIPFSIEKLIRLWKNPWNDFRQEFGIFTVPIQIGIHQAILLFALLGVISSVCSLKRSCGNICQDKARNISKMYLACIILIHLAYIPFIAVPRYSLSSMPFLIVFCAIGIENQINIFLYKRGARALFKVILYSLLLCILQNVQMRELLSAVNSEMASLAPYAHNLARLVGWGVWLATIEQVLHSQAANPQRLKLFISLVFSLSIPIICTPLRANGRFGEFKIALKDHPLSINLEALPPDSFLAIDGTNLYNADIDIILENKTINAMSIPSLSLISDFKNFRTTAGGFRREDEWVLNALASASSRKCIESRQWSIVPIGEGLSNQNRQIQIRIKQSKTDNPALYGGSAFTPLPSLTSYSWEKEYYGVEDNCQFCDPRFDLPQNALEFSDHIQTEHINLLVLKKSPAMSKHKIMGNALLDKNLTDDLRLSQSTNYSLASLPQNEKLWIIRISGSFSSSRTCTVLSNTDLHIDRIAGNGAYYHSPWLERQFLAKEGEMVNFDYSAPFSPVELKQALNTHIKAISQTYTPSRKDAKLSFNELRLRIYPLSFNPLSLNPKLFVKYDNRKVR